MDRPTVHNLHNNAWSVFLDQDPFIQPLTRTTIDQNGPLFDPWSLGLTIGGGQQ